MKKLYTIIACAMLLWSVPVSAKEKDFIDTVSETASRPLVSDETANTIMNGVGKFSDQMSKAIDVVTVELIDKAPKAAELILGVIQFKGAFELISSALAIFIIIMLTYSGVSKLMKWDKTLSQPNQGMGTLLSFMLVVCGGVLIFFQANDLLNPITWLAALCPEGIVAMKALAAIGVNI